MKKLLSGLTACLILFAFSVFSFADFNVMTDDKSISEDLLKTTAEWLAENL